MAENKDVKRVHRAKWRRKNEKKTENKRNIITASEVYNGFGINQNGGVNTHKRKRER